jgi:ribA/ribD-fused uncharacterized protein
VRFEGREYPSTEHAYQAAKTLDEVERTNIRLRPDPADAKKYGRRLTVREDWEDVKLQVMEELLYEKFTRHSSFRRRLFTTFPHKLVEGNWWEDTFWGVCNGKGLNHLGRLLMEVRETLLEGELRRLGLEPSVIESFVSQSIREENDAELFRPTP